MPLFIEQAHPHPLWLTLSLISVAVLFMGIGKAGFGGGVGLVSPPLMAMAIPVTLMLPLMLPLLMACDVFSIWSWRGKWDLRQFWILLPGTVVGVGVGTLLLTSIPEPQLKAGLGALAIGFVVIQLVRQRCEDEESAYVPKLWHGLVAGCLGAFCSVLAHAAGPIITLYLLPQGLGKERFVATTVIYYTALNWIKVPSYIGAGILTVPVLLSALWLFPLIPLGVWAGVRLNKLVPEKLFNNVVYAIVVVTGVKLLIG